MEPPWDILQDETCSKRSTNIQATFGLTNVFENGDCFGDRLLCSRNDDNSAMHLAGDEGSWGHDTVWCRTQAWVAQPPSSNFGQVTARGPHRDGPVCQVTAPALHGSLNTPCHSQVLVTSTPLTTPPTPPLQPPEVSPSLALLGNTDTENTASDLQHTRGSRVFEDRPSVSDSACVHTCSAVSSSIPYSTLNIPYQLSSVQHDRESMPCIHDETFQITKTFPHDTGRRNTADWPKVVPKPIEAFTNNDCSIKASMYIDVVNHAPDTANIEAVKQGKTTEAISKKDYFLRREDKDVVEISSDSETMVISNIAISECAKNDMALSKKNKNTDEQAKKATKRTYERCHDTRDCKTPPKSPPRKIKRNARTPPPITRTPHPAAPTIPGTAFAAPRPSLALSSTIKAVPLQTEPLDSRPLSPIAHLKILDPAPRSLAIPQPRASRNFLLPSAATTFMHSGVFTNRPVLDGPIRPVPIAGSLRPSFAPTDLRYLSLQFPRPMLPIVPPLTTFTGAPLTFIHPGIPILTRAPNQTLPSFSNLPPSVRFATSLENINRPQFLPGTDHIGPHSVTVRQQYGSPLVQPRRQARQRRQSSSESQPTEDGGPETHVARRKQANSRERERVNHLNTGFEHLKQVLPWMHHGRRMSKVDTLRAAIDYIDHLQRLLWEADTASYLNEANKPIVPSHPTTDVCKCLPHPHYPRFGFLPTSLTFSEDPSRTAVGTYRGLDLGPPPITMPRLAAPPPPPLHEGSSVHWLQTYGVVPLRLTANPVQISTQASVSMETAAKMNDATNSSCVIQREEGRVG